MAHVLILGGGFSGVVAAEELGLRLGREHRITLVARRSQFIFYPALVRLAFGECEPDDVSFDVRAAMLERRVNFIEAEVARVAPDERRVYLTGGEMSGELGYDYLIYALGRRLATERVPGFFEHAHHLLTVEAALKFGEAVRNFRSGRAVIGYCRNARLDVPVFETAFALARRLKKHGERARITVLAPEPPVALEGAGVSQAMRHALDAQHVESLPNFSVRRVHADHIESDDGKTLDYDLLMLIPPFQGAGAIVGSEITDREGFIRVERTMRVRNARRMYAVGDCVSFEGAKMGHMAVRQGAVAAANVASEIEGSEPSAKYEHEMKLIIDTGDRETLYFQKDLWDGDAETIKRGRFWRWAKRAQELYWQQKHA